MVVGVSAANTDRGQTRFARAAASVSIIRNGFISLYLQSLLLLTNVPSLAIRRAERLKACAVPRNGAQAQTIERKPHSRSMYTLKQGVNVKYWGASPITASQTCDHSGIAANLNGMVSGVIFPGFDISSNRVRRPVT